MKAKLSILFLLAVNLLYGQYDYFKWPKANTNLLGVAVSPKSGLAVDVFNRCYYIDNVSKKIRFMYGDVLSTAPIARSNSNLIYKNNPSAGDRFYYVTSTNKISSIKYNNSVGAWQVGTEFNGITEDVAPLSFIDIVDENQAYYIRNSDKKVCQYWHNSSGSGFGPISNTALPAAAYSNIVMKNSTVYYIANNNKLSYIKYNSATSSWGAPVNLNTDVIATGSKIQVEPNTGQIFYVRASDNRLCSYWTIGSSSGFGPVNKAEIGIAAMSGTDIIIPPSGDQVIYIGIDGNLHNEFYDICKWAHNRLNAECNLTSNYNSFAMDNNGALYFFDGTNISTLSKIVAPTDFVHRKGARLEMNNQKFNAKIADYCLEIYRRNGLLFLGPSNHYDNTISDWVCLTSTNCSTILDQHFQNISDAGFNSIRFNGLQACTNNTSANPNVDPKIYCEVWDIPLSGSSLPSAPILIDINSGNILSQLLALYTSVVNKAGDNGLKVNFFAGLAGGHKIFNTACHANYGTYLNALANNFKTNPDILMYDLILEADLYNSESEMITNKNYICSTVNNWYEQIRNVDKNHLVSLGIIGSGALTNFDPGILNVDVMTYHVYPDLYTTYSPDYFYKSLKWFSNIMNDDIQKPWIVGETGLPAVPNPSSFTYTPSTMRLVDYAAQKNYAIMSLQNVFLSGASGYGWWQYKDVYGPADDYGVYFGLVDRNGNNKDIIANGSSVFNTTAITNGCNQGTAPTDYYNQLAPYNTYPYHLSGFVKDGVGNPIVNATVSCSFDCGGSWKTFTTFTRSDGSYTLNSQCAVTNLKIAGVGKIVLTTGSPVNGATYTLSTVTCNSIYTKSMEQTETAGLEDSLDELNNLLDENSLTISPNPFTSKVKFSFETEQTLTSIRITDVLGKEVKNITFSGKELEIGLEGSPKGIYMVNITNSEHKTIIKKIIAQ